MSLQLNNYLLDIVIAIDGGCKLQTYKIAASSAASAFERWQNEETTEFPLIYEGDIVPAIIVGIAQQ